MGFSLQIMCNLIMANLKIMGRETVSVATAAARRHLGGGVALSPFSTVTKHMKVAWGGMCHTIT